MIGTLLAATIVAAAPGTDAREAYAHRQFLLEADAKCHLLSERERAAMAGSAQQAQGVLTRAGIRPGPIRDKVAADAADTPCTDPDLRKEAAAARAAFTRWATLQRQDFPGEVRTWRASRTGRPDVMAWTLWQELDGGFRLGVAESAEDRAVVLALPSAKGAVQPRTVSVEFRDPSKWRDFVEPTLGGLFPAAADGDPLAGRAAPPALSRRLWTSGRVEADVDYPDPESRYLYWRLPDDTLQELSDLDPRDVARLTVEYPDNTAKELFVEVGDLAAALAFLAAGDTPSTHGK